MKKSLLILLVILLCSGCVACSNNDVYVPDFPEYEVPEVNKITQSEAIKLAQEDAYVKDFIANLSWLKHYYISWGTCEAYLEESPDSWTVYLKGNVSGYTDDYKTNYKSAEKFSIIVDVSSSGIVGYPRNNFNDR